MSEQALTNEEVEHGLDVALTLAEERQALAVEVAKLKLRVAQQRGLLEQLLEEFQDRQDITDSGGPDWCMRSAMRIESTLAEGE